MKTYIESLIDDMCARNTPVMPVDKSQVVITSGPVRLANRNPAAVVGLAKNLLQGSSAKEVKAYTIGTPTAGGCNLTVGLRTVGLIVRVSGSQNTFRRGPISLLIEQGNSSTGVAVPNGTAVTKFTIYPAEQTATVIVLLTSDNGGVGQVTAFTGVALEYVLADNAGDVANEYVISIEPITLRDFTTRENVA